MEKIFIGAEIEGRQDTNGGMHIKRKRLLSDLDVKDILEDLNGESSKGYKNKI